ncbi:MAG: TldD/PmbA family protein [Lachnospiraceae bacterium]|nr:TldD/PmbA family protein [Lachnospiraceae bacterium]
MLTKQKLESYLSRCMQSAADFAEIFEQFEEYEMLETLDLKVEKASRKVTAGLGVRLYREVQSVYGYTNDNSEEAILALVDDLRAAIGEAAEGAGEKAVELTRVEYENRHPVKVDYRDVSLEDKAELIFRAERAAKAQDERIVKTAGKLLNVREEVQISNSEGRLVSDIRVRTRMMMSAYASENGVFMEGGDRPGAGKGLEFFEEKTPEEIGKEAARQAIVMLSARDCPSGKMPVIIDNEFGGVIFHESCGHALEATGVAKNQSIFAGKKGQQIAAPCVSAVDDGTIPNAWGSQNVDDEGNFQEKRVLIKDGILQSYMVDRLNGRRMGEPSTGSGRRESYKYEPTSRMSNTFICAGTDSFESLFEGVERGLYAKKMGGGSVNPQTGEFNFAVEEGYLIENGKISYPVKGASLIGNGRDILMNIDKVSSNLARGQGMCGSMSGSIPTDVGQPSLRVSSITVGGTANE